MTILASDIKLLQSERMTDTSDGGGRRTSSVIPDGVAGNIFPKVSRLDSVYGRVNLRKVFAHVDSANTETYAGAHCALIDDADNSKIKVNLFTTGNDFDNRTAARDRVESYVVAGPESRMYLYGRQLAGQQAITTVQRVEDALPEVGEVLCLSKETAGVINYQQFVRVENVDHEVRTFTDGIGDYQRRIITMSTSAVLRYEFVGIEELTRLTFARTSLVRNTTVADAARYFGIAAVQDPAAQNDLTLSVESIFSNIVPTTLRETAVSNAEISGSVRIGRTSNTPLPFANVTPPLPASALTTTTITLGRPVAPGSFSVRVGIADGSVFAAALTDNRKGVIPGQVAMVDFGFYIQGGTIDYETGTAVVTWHGQGQGSMVLNASYIPGVEIAQPTHTRELPMTLNTRGTVHVLTLDPLPAQGSTFVDFRALGKWYRLRDNGDGVIVGDDAAYGTGTLDPITGALVVTLGALPDVGSSLLIGWASPVHHKIRAGATSNADSVVHQRFKLANLPIVADSVAVQYTAGATTYTVLDNGAGQFNSNGIVGTVNYSTGDVDLTYSVRLPNAESQITVSYNQKAAVDIAQPVRATGTDTISGAGPHTFVTAAGVAVGGLSMVVQYLPPNFATVGGEPMLVQVRDNGVGGLITLSTQRAEGSRTLYHPGGENVGTVNYSTGEVVLDGTVTMNTPDYFYNFGVWNWRETNEVVLPTAAAEVSWSVELANASSGVAKVEVLSQAVAPLTLDLTTNISSPVVPGSVWFTAFGKTYFDRGGILYHTVQFDGTGTVAGTINYGTGQATLTQYTNNVALGLTVRACLTRFGDFSEWAATFRTAGAPLRPASTFVQVVALDGETLTATADEDGALVGDFVRGNVNQQIGLVSIEWGEMVVAAGNETEPWFDPDNVVGANVWKPRDVLPDTLTYSTVVLTSLPVNADILGLDPVRLPSDGRVPIFRAGDVILIHNTKDFVLPNPPVASATYNVGRTNLADCYLLDAAGTRVPTNKYVVNLATGAVTMAADFVMGALVGPLKARHRIEELNLAADVQINGQITLASPLGVAFDGDTKVSSCLLFGDLFARTTNVFDQVTFTGVWSDVRIGANATAEYDTINFPIEVKNDGAVTERWRINFLTSTTYQVIGENLGVIATGATNADCTPVNPLTGEAYFTIRAGGWGAGWSAGQQLRFNTVGASGSIWMARTVLPGATLSGDSIDIQLRGDVDA